MRPPAPVFALLLHPQLITRSARKFTFTRLNLFPSESVQLHMTKFSVQHPQKRAIRISAGDAYPLGTIRKATSYFPI